jgi:hypothetical protein
MTLISNYPGWWLYAVLIVAWFLFRPLRDYYVLEVRYFNRVYRNKEPYSGEMPSRGDQNGPSLHECFDDFVAAKAKFDYNELNLIPVAENEWIESQQSILKVSARTRAFTLIALKGRNWFFGSFFGSRDVVLHTTPVADIMKRRKVYSQP